MGKRYRQVSKLDRELITQILLQGFSKARIARNLGFHRSTIYREIKRNGYSKPLESETLEAKYPKQDEEMCVLRSWRSGGSIRARQVNNVLKRLALKTLERIKPKHDNIEKFTAFSVHKIRHIMGSDLEKANLSMDIRKQLIQHSKIETTLEYSHLSEKELHEAINQLK